MRALILLALLSFSAHAVAPSGLAPRPDESQPANGPGGAASIAVVRGRANLFDGQLTRTLTRASEPLKLGTGFLEGGAGAELEVLWSAGASARVRGASSFAFDRQRTRGRIQARFFQSMDVESRRLPLSLDLPGGWTLHLRSAALFVKELPDGGLEVEHRGGREVLLTSRVERQKGSFPAKITGGQRVRLSSGER